MIRKLINIMIGLFLILGVTYANVEGVSPKDNLDSMSKIKMFFSGLKGLTIEGELEGCAVNYEYQREVFGYGSYRTLTELALKPVSKDGRVNIYALNSDGSYKFLAEKRYGEKYLFAENTKYVIEFYKCSVKKQTPYVTADGYKNGDLVCKGGSYLAKVEFTSPTSYTYEKVKHCGNGCSFSVCDDSKQTVTEELESHYSNGSSAGTWSDKEVEQQYSKVVEQLKGEIIDLAKLNEELRKQSLSENYNEIKSNEGQIEAILKEIKDVENQAEGVPTSTIITGLLLLSGAVYLGVKK